MPDPDEAVRQNYNLTDAAKALFTSQPGVSKAIIELEEELGVDIFARHGKRIRGLTEPGRLVLGSVELIMQEIDILKRIGKEYAAQDSGSFTIATTHTQARYTLPKVVQAFMQKYPKVRLSLLTWSTSTANTSAAVARCTSRRRPVRAAKRAPSRSTSPHCRISPASAPA